MPRFNRLARENRLRKARRQDLHQFRDRKRDLDMNTVRLLRQEVVLHPPMGTAHSPSPSHFSRSPLRMRRFIPPHTMLGLMAARPGSRECQRLRVLKK